MSEPTDELWKGAWTQRSIEEHPWLRENRNDVMGGPAGGGECRWYAPKGCRWPLLCVTVYVAYPQPPLGVLVSVSYKDGADGWFTNCNLPRSLTADLAEMLRKIS